MQPQCYPDCVRAICARRTHTKGIEDPMDLMEQQLVRCGVPPVRLYEHLALTSSANALSVQQQQQQQQHQHDASQHPAAHPLSSWLSPSTALLYGNRGGTPSPYPTAPSFPYPALSWSWQPPVAMISRRSSPSSAGVRYAPYPTPTSTPPPLRARPATPN
ncbi:hypothetical protein PV325_009073 [Microctonus aethiopoides]|nr:hypothetical protein PV325_009073 [Microctonus aethiopoides]